MTQNTTPCMDAIASMLRTAVNAKREYWDAMIALETGMASEEGFTESQDTAAFGFVESLAAGGGTVGMVEAAQFMQAVATAGISERHVGMSTAVAAPERPAVTLDYDQFTEAYAAHMAAGGTQWSATQLQSSWYSYQRDPAGHFVSNHQMPPKFAVGQMVYVAIEDGAKNVIQWTGKVLSVKDVGDSHEVLYEYHVEDCPVVKGSGEFPLLAWEEQLKPVFAPDGTMLDRKGNRSVFDDVDK